MNAKPLMSVVLMSAVYCTFALAGSADEALDATVSQYRGADARGRWHNSWMVQAAGSTAARGPSADERLLYIVSGHTRDALDRGGWANAMLTNSTYAAGNALLAVRIGDGVTTATVEDVRVSADKQLGWIIASYNRDMLDRGGWENVVQTNSRYASGNALLAVRLGEGLTTGGAARPSEVPSEVASNVF